MTEFRMLRALWLTARPSAAALSICLASSPAAADFRTDITALVAAIDASPQWSATVRDIVVRGDAGTIAGLSIRAEGDKVLWLDLEGMTVEGYESLENGGFSFTSAEIQRARFEFGEFSFTYDQMRLDEFSVPEFPAIDTGRPLAALVKVYGALAKASLLSGKVASVTGRGKGGTRGDIAYRSIEFGPLRDGVLQRSKVGPVRMEATGDQGELTFAIDEIEARDINIATLVHVLDPDRFVNGIGDRIWREAVGLVRYRNMTVAVPDGRAEIGSLFLENLRLRQPRTSFTPMYEEMLLNPDMSEEEARALFARYGVDYLSSFSAGRLGFDEFGAAGAGIDRFRVGGLRLVDASLAGIGEFAISDVEVAVPEAGEFSMRRFALGDIVFPDEEVLRAALAAEVSETGADGPPMAPQVGFVEAIGVRAFSPDRVDVAVARARVDLSGYIGSIPTSVATVIEGVSVDSSIIPSRRLRTVVQRLGYDRLAADYRYHAYWREIDQRLVIENLKMTVGNAGSVSVDVELSGLTRADLENPERLAEAIEHLNFENATVRVEDDSLLNRAFDMQAKELGIEAHLLKEQMSGALPFFLLPLGNPEFAGKLAPVLREFILAPGVLLLTARPGAPIPLAELVDAAESAPETLPDLLRVEVRKE